MPAELSSSAAVFPARPPPITIESYDFVKEVGLLFIDLKETYQYEME